LQPLAGAWLEHLSDGEHPVVVMPPLGAIAPSRLIVGVHGAGDRPDWSCGGWRLASQVTAFVVCPQGANLTHETFAWASGQQLSERLEAALAVARARYAPYVDDAAFIYAGFSQGATLAEPFLLKNAARFPIAILAEGGYATARSPAFGRAFYAAGGRRIVLVCGSPTCFQSTIGARKVLETAGLQVLVVGDAKAGHNLNERMQQALQGAWPEIAAPLASR
jgi:predicted esterase